jgi:predicted dehydrogenase
MSIRVGIVGTGFGAQVHAPAYQAHEAFELVAIASPNRAQAVAKERGIPQAFPSLAAMLDGVELDAVSIASPPFMHRDDAVLAFSHGKHVLCEKPLARTVEEAEEIVAAARRAGTACGVAFEFRFDASRQALKELVVNQHLGPLREIEFASHDDASAHERAQAGMVVRESARRRNHPSVRFAHDRRRDVVGWTSPSELLRLLTHRQPPAARF